MLEFRRRMEEVSKRIKGRSSKLAFERRAYKSPSVQTASFEPLWGVGISGALSCPRGKKRRRVTCGPFFEQSPPHMCDQAHKPSEVSSCQMPCITTTTSTTTERTSSIATTTQMPPHTTLQYRNINNGQPPFYRPVWLCNRRITAFTFVFISFHNNAEK